MLHAPYEDCFQLICVVLRDSVARDGGLVLQPCRRGTLLNPEGFCIIFAEAFLLARLVGLSGVSVATAREYRIALWRW